MIQLIADDYDLLSLNQGRDKPDIGCISCRVDQRGLNSLEFAHFLFGLKMDIHRSGDGADGATTCAILPSRLNHRFDDFRVIRQIQVIVG